MMGFPDERTVKRLREAYPVGCRVVLDAMDDPYRRLPVGGQGTCRGVDDAGNIMVSWDCGSSLSVAYSADSCHRVASEEEVRQSLEWLGQGAHKPTRCPRCGVLPTPDNQLHAVSRRAHVSICDACGILEALEDFPGEKKIPKLKLTDWAIVKAGWKE